jgi:hypothetical protein
MRVFLPIRQMLNMPNCLSTWKEKQGQKTGGYGLKAANQLPRLNPMRQCLKVSLLAIKAATSCTT